MEGILFIRDLAVTMVIAGTVGWVFQRLRLSVVVGYLLAGIVIGPYTPPFQLVSDLARVQTLAQLGLVFLIFSIGLGLSFARLQRLGISVAAATFISALLIFSVFRSFGLGFGWSNTQSIFLAGMLMVSSSAIISKVLEELNITHQRPGQLALGVTVLEDVVAVIMLTLLGSLVYIGRADDEPLWATIGTLSAFVVFLIFLSMLLLPRLLNLMTNSGTAELRAIVVTGLVLSAAFFAVRAGYSLALGAFILGVVIAGTRYKDEVEKTFDPLRNIFGAVFFVAMGMMFNVRLLLDAWWLIILISLLVLIARPFACAFGLIVVGNTSRNAIRAGLVLTPIGEFSFVIAQLGVTSKALPEVFYAIAVGVSLVTSIVGPLLARHSEAISRKIENIQPEILRNSIELHHRWLSAVKGRRNASLLWKLTSKRILQTTLQLLFVTALVLFARPLYYAALEKFGNNIFFPHDLQIGFWTLFGLILIGPIITIWRNIEALAMIFSEGVTRGHPRRQALRPVLQAAVKSLAAVLLIAWMMILLPFGWTVLWALGVVVALLMIFGFVFWRRLIRLHSKVEIELRERIQRAALPAGSSALSPALFLQPAEWDLQIEEIALSAQTNHAGKQIKELALRKRLGCSIVGIDRQGFLIANPSADERLFPGDKLLLLGTEQQLAQAEEFLKSASSESSSETFMDLTTEAIPVPADSPANGKTLLDLDVIRKFGVQVCGIQRANKRLLVPAGDERIHSGDTLLLLGTHDKIQECAAYLQTANEH